MSGFVREQLGVNRTRGGEGCSLDAFSELLPPRFFTGESCRLFTIQSC